MGLVKLERRFPDTSREAPYQQGTTTCNSFYDPRDISNINNGVIAPSGRYATRYPTNVASNTQGFTLPENTNNPKNMFYGSANGMMYGTGNYSSQGSASDYLIYNKFFENLLYPHNKMQLQGEINPLYANASNIMNGRGYDGMRGMHGGAVGNSPSNGSASDYKMNNPYDAPDTFLGGAVGNSPSNGSANDYSLNNPYASMAPDTFLTTPFDKFHPKLEMRGNGIDWNSFISKVSENLHKLPHIVDTGLKVGNSAKEVISTIKKLREELKKEKKQGKKEEDEEEETMSEEEEEEEKPKRRKRRTRKLTGKGYI